MPGHRESLGTARWRPANSCLRRRLTSSIGWEAFEEKRDRNAKDKRDLLKPARADAVGALLVFLHLLECQAEPIGELLLAHAKHHSAHADTRPHMLVGWVRLFFVLGAGECPGHGQSVGRGEKGTKALASFAGGHRVIGTPLERGITSRGTLPPAGHGCHCWPVEPSLDS